MRKVVLFYMLMLTLSCASDDIGLASNPIDSNIVIEVGEELEHDSRRITLFCKTEKIYPCYNFGILTDTRTYDDAQEITFTKVDQQRVCLTALGPAKATVELGDLPNGEYSIALNNANLKNKGTLRVTDSEIVLQFGRTKGIQFVRSATKRVPPNTYWGMIRYGTASTSQQAELFIQRFADIGAEFHPQEPGHYYHYEIDDSGNLVADPLRYGSSVKTFIFQYDGDESKLKDLIQSEGASQHGSISIRVETYKGEVFRNWGN